MLASLATYGVYEDDGGDPAVTVATAREHLACAAELAAEVGRHLEHAQRAINHQGYHTAGG